MTDAARSGRSRIVPVVGLVLGLVAWGVPATAYPSREVRHEPAPLRILLIGDSVTQGSAGDWTWRYRLWRQFEAAGVAVDLVGPRDVLADLPIGSGSSQAYLDPDFDRDHAAWWGMSLTTPRVPVGDLVATYQPDVVVEMLGVNDLQFGASTPEQVVDQLRDLVGEVRAVDPEVDVVLGALFQRWREGVPEVNAALPALATELDEAGSRVTASDLGTTVTRADTWDGSHPSATGELKIAVAVARALDGIGVPVAFPDPPPTVREGPPDPAHLRLRRAGPHAVGLAWRLPLGATEARMWQRDRTRDGPWRRLPFTLGGHRWTARQLTTGHRYAFRLQAAKGSAVANGVFSEVVRARAFRSR